MLGFGDDSMIVPRIAGLIVAAALGAGRLSAAAPFQLPAPTGTFPVGTTTWRLTDRSRKETLAAAGFRSVEVLAWYPAAPRRGALAPYLREGVAEVRPFAKLFGAPETAFDGLADVQTHAELDAAPAPEPATFPLLVFSHGYTGVPSSYTALLEELASHGYVVLSIVHPYEATAATLTDGRVVSMNGADGKFVPGVQQVFTEWGAEDKTMAAVTRASTDADRMTLLRGYLGGLRRTDEAVRRWVQDTRLVLDRLSSLPKSTVAGQLAARVDMKRMGAFGHSMGGVTAAAFCLEDKRCRAALNLDGIPQYGSLIDSSLGRPFLMVYSERPGRLGASDAIYARAARPYYRVDVKDTRHLDFSDMVFWGGPLRQRPVMGAIEPSRAVDATRAIVRQYFDQELLGQRSPMLSGTSPFPEVAVRTVAPVAR
jgi:predicted dienelactone hydrolase